ncbi:S-adenosyl-L-methionine-dependent methyltransferase [Spinellus fusiger]|nr:S-adenosyl-L-methionine-dependent methyltransferase [Spinellus fusiger]
MGNQMSQSSKSSKSSKGSKNKADSIKSTSTEDSSADSNQPIFSQHYLLPCTEEETLRLRTQHYLVKYIFQKNIRAPLEDLLAHAHPIVLDVGSGDKATWLNDMAMDYPSAIFHGVDIVQALLDNPEENNLPPNCRLVKADLMEGIPYPDNTFDYVHQRMMATAYPSESVDFIMSEIVRVTKPGGWVEMMEGDLPPKRCGPEFKHVFKTIRDVFHGQSQSSASFRGHALHQHLRHYCFTDVEASYLSVPVCWGGAVGKMSYEIIAAFLRNMAPVFYPLFGMKGDYDTAVYEQYIDKAFNECVEFQTFINIHWVYGKKPLA